MDIHSDGKQKTILLQLAGLAGFFALLFGVMNALGLFEPKTAVEHTLTYRVEGTASAAVVTYTGADGDHSSPEDVRVPWKKTMKLSGPRTVVLTVGNPAQTGEIRCVLLLDGIAWKQDTAIAPADKASCAGIVP
jgi:hypothetical protein